MPKLTMYVPAMKLKVIDAYCAEKGIARSALMTNCTLSFLNSRQGAKVQCEKCKRNAAVGKYNLVIHDWNAGETDTDMNLCQYCLDKAKKEGVTIKDA